MSYTYIYEEKNKNHPTFVLLHGTGGQETDLLKVANWLDDSYNILAVRGDVEENGNLRFFRRNGHGNYDIEDLNQRGKALYQFIEKFARENALDISKVIPVGFSNGSNIAINMLLRDDSSFKKAILMAPMYPVELSEGLDLSDLTVFLSMGKQDPITPLSDSENVIDIFESRGAQVTKHWTQGHQITQDVLKDAKNFINEISEIK